MQYEYLAGIVAFSALVYIGYMAHKSDVRCRKLWRDIYDN